MGKNRDRLGIVAAILDAANPGTSKTRIMFSANLNYTPWGIRLTPITLSLLGFTLICALIALLREYQAKTEIGT